MKIKLENLDAAVTEILTKIRAGVRAAREAGVIAELPEKVDFQVEVIIDYQGLEEQENGTSSSSESSVGVKPQVVTQTIREGGGETSTQVTTQNTNQSVSTTEDSVTSKLYGNPGGDE